MADELANYSPEQFQAAARNLIITRGLPPSAENMNRALEVVYNNPRLLDAMAAQGSNQVNFSTGKTSLPNDMFLGDDFASPGAQAAPSGAQQAQAAAPVQQAAPQAAQQVPPPGAPVASSQSSQQETGNVSGSPVGGVPLIPLVAAAATARQPQAAPLAVQDATGDRALLEAPLKQIAGPQAPNQQVIEMVPTPGPNGGGDIIFAPAPPNSTESDIMAQLENNGTVPADDSGLTVVDDPKLGNSAQVVDADGTRYYIAGNAGRQYPVIANGERVGQRVEGEAAERILRVLRGAF